MVSNRGIRQTLLVLLVLFLSTPAWADADPSERERALEQRVAELERLVNQLLMEREGDAAGQEVAEVRREVDAVNERVAAVEERETADVVRGATRFNFGGYIKADTMVSRYSGGSVPAQSLNRDFSGFPP